MNAHDPRIAPPLERADGAARVVWGHRGAETKLADLYQRAPCRLLFPTPEDGDPPTGVLLTTSGGLTGGDRLVIEVHFEAGSKACVTTQAAEKIYRSACGDAQVDIKVMVEDGACAEWLMQETILFDGARLSRRSHFNVAQTARFLAVELLVFGRSAMGERFRRGRVRDVWRLERDQRPIWIDVFQLDGDIEKQRRPFRLGDAAGCATILYAGSDAAQHAGVARKALGETDALGGATSFDGVLIVRALAPDAAALRAAVGHVITSLRAVLFGLPPRLPRVWSV